ncbi:dihydrofolate reductase [Bacillus toyonensis]|uniref:dihydrofolate reductase n=1 Tax=Bacillus toyonensis TaxID=155322 RepID=A0AB36TA12_9BACI|nr:dihydrofolate reductase [Bacillus toyonensis]PEN91778.1 dihydrofolate reductase [Bacillus toyonensis]
MIISAMVAVGENNIIGKNNDIPWRLPNDWAYLRRITMGHSIILGRKNYESIGKPLDGRKNIVLTKNKNYKADGCHIAYSIEDALSKCEGDRYFPEIDFSLWKEIYTEKGIQNDKNPYEYYFHVFEKIKL